MQHTIQSTEQCGRMQNITFNQEAQHERAATASQSCRQTLADVTSWTYSDNCSDIWSEKELFVSQLTYRITTSRLPSERKDQWNTAFSTKRQR